MSVSSMPGREEVPIVNVEAAPGAKHEKTKRGYQMPIVYTLEDGRRVNATMTRSTLRSLKEDLANPAKIVRGLKASFEDGKFWGTVITIDFR